MSEPSLTEFLRARLAEDEEAARETRWLALEYGVDSAGRQAFAARVLLEVEAKRRIVERHAKCGSGTGYCDDGGHGWYPEGGCGDLADLAAVYADHDDYDESWRP